MSSALGPGNTAAGLLDLKQKNAKPDMIDGLAYIFVKILAEPLFGH